MLSQSLSQTGNLLASQNHFPAGMIIELAQAAPAEVRNMFLALFDETKDVYERMAAFKLRAEELRQKYDSQAKMHFQDENAISVYLWLRYPDKYYIYKMGEVKSLANELKSDYRFKRGAYEGNIRNSFAFYDEVCSALKKDGELVQLFRSRLDGTCYPDPELRTLTVDIGYYTKNVYLKKSPVNKAEWFPSDYNPGLTVDDWVQLLQDKEIFTPSRLEVMKRLKDIGGQATCTQLSLKYGESKNFYNNNSSTLARRVVEKTGCPLFDKNAENSKWWPILYVGRFADKEKEETSGIYIWKLRDELSQALDRVDLSQVKLYADPSLEPAAHGYWWLNANPKIWSFSDIAVGAVQAYTLYSDTGHKRRIFQNFLDAKEGDLVIGYESTPVKKVVALCRISRAQDGKNLYFEKLEGLVSPIDYETLKDCPELKNMEYFGTPQGSLFKLTQDEYDFIINKVREENSLSSKQAREVYTKEDFLREVYMTENRYDELIEVLKNKKNLILQGAPGVGKTFAARRLAYATMGEKDDSRIEFVQFHQNYSYEDFMMGYKPVEEGFKLKYGIFYRFCQKAANQPEKDHFFIIDEINRGNMSKIFGELLMLIEKDYRGTKMTLAYDERPFSVPENLYIIGMMNTADRSLAMIDYALRRRFSFFEMEPGFDTDGFTKYQDGLKSELFIQVIAKIKELNEEIVADTSLGKGFRIGHSYFCGCHETDCTEAWLRAVVDYDLLPMLSEYWFDDADKLQRWETVLHGIF